MGFVAEIFFADEQVAHPVDPTRLCDLAQRVLDAEGVTSRAEVSVLAVDEDTMAEFNLRFLGREGPTDVLAFPIEEGPWDRQIEESGNDYPILLGDVLLCPMVAAHNAETFDRPLLNELDLLLVHGLLHLLGYDHVVDVQAERMEGRERELLENFAESRGETYVWGGRSGDSGLHEGIESTDDESSEVSVVVEDSEQADLQASESKGQKSKTQKAKLKQTKKLEQEGGDHPDDSGPTRE